MPRYDFTTHRLFVDTDLRSGIALALDRKQANHIINVLRHKHGDEILLFNGRDGEWLSVLEMAGEKSAALIPRQQTRPQPDESLLQYIFAPLKKGRLDYMVQKAVEMGAGTLQPVVTEYTQNPKIDVDKIGVNIIESAQQCGIISVPKCSQPVRIAELLQGWNEDTPLIFCDEGAESQNPLDALNELKAKRVSPTQPLAVLIGPEGGFSEAERRLLLEKSYVTAIPLGPRVLRADTAAVAALAVVQATIGDWY